MVDEGQVPGNEFGQLRQALIDDVTFVRAEKLAFGPEAREQAVAAARARLGEIIEGEYRSAA